MIRITLTVDILGHDNEFRSELLDEGKELALEGIIDTLWPQEGRQLVIGSTGIRQEVWQ